MTFAMKSSTSYALALLIAVFASSIFSAVKAESRYLPEFERSMPNQTVTLGTEAVLTCHVAHLGGYKVGWIKSDSKAIQAIHTHVITHNARVSVRHFGHTTWQLVMRDVERSDEGAYMCQINTDPMKSQVAYLRVVVPPQIEPPTDANGNNEADVMVSEGSSVKLTCKPKGDPYPVVRWYREDGEDIVMRTANNNGGAERLRFTTYEGETLTLMKISRLDMAVYVCTASNGIPPAASRRIAVNVNFNPVVNVPSQLIWSSIGNNFTMECNVEAYPRSVNYWIRGDGELIISGLKFSVSEVRESIFASRMALTVNSFDKSDIGKYRCIAKNSLGEVEGRIHVYESHTWPVRGATTKAPNQISDYEDEEEEEEIEKNESSNDIDESDDENNNNDDDEYDNRVRSTSANWAVGVPPSAGRNTVHQNAPTTTESSSWRNRARNSKASSISASSSFILIPFLLLLPNSVNFFNHILFFIVPYNFSH